MKIYFVRHGKTEYNIDMRLQGGQVDSPLIPEGREDATRAGIRLATVPFDKIYASSQQRAKDTATLLLQESDFNTPGIIEDSAFREMDFGDWDGKYIEEVKEEKEFLALRELPAEYQPQKIKGESYIELVNRSKEGLSIVIQKNKNADNILIVSHAITITTLIKHLTGEPVEKYRRDGLVDNASISILETMDNGKSFRLLLYNSN